MNDPAASGGDLWELLLIRCKQLGTYPKIDLNRTSQVT